MISKIIHFCWLSSDPYPERIRNCLLSWKKILPLTVPDDIMKEMETVYFSKYPGAITSGCGGGYIIVISEKEVPGEVRIKVRY